MSIAFPKINLLLYFKQIIAGLIYRFLLELPPMKHFISKSLFYFSLVFIAYIAGAVSSHYKTPDSKYIKEAIIGGEAWYGRLLRERLFKEDGDSEPSAVAEPLVYWNKNKAFNGVTMVSLRSGKDLQLVNMEGKTIYTWDLNYSRIWPNPEHINNIKPVATYANKAQVFPNGDLLVQFSSGVDTPYGYGLARLDKNSNILWKLSENTHHDFYVDTHNGDIYSLLQKFVMETPEGYEGLPFPMLADYVAKISKDGKVLNKVMLIKAFKNSPFYEMLFFGNVEKRWDHTHANSIMKLEPEMAAKFPMFKPGQILISIRNPSILAVMDMDEEKIVWATTGEWKMQHEAKFTNNGTIILYDNRGYIDTRVKTGRVLYIDPKNGKIIREYKNLEQPFYSKLMGGVEELSNGNMLIFATEQNKIIELTPENKAVWEFQLPPGVNNNIIDAARYGTKELPFLYRHAQ